MQFLGCFGLRDFSGFQHTGVYIVLLVSFFTVVLYCFVFVKTKNVIVKTKNVTYQGFYKQENFEAG